MYELKDSYFAIFDTQSIVIISIIIAFTFIGFFYLRHKRKHHQ